VKDFITVQESKLRLCNALLVA